MLTPVKSLNICVTVYYCLLRFSIAVKRHHDQSNYYKGKHSIGAGFQFQRYSPCWEGRHHTGGHGAGEVAERVLHLDQQATGSNCVLL